MDALTDPHCVTDMEVRNFWSKSGGHPSLRLPPCRTRPAISAIHHKAKRLERIYRVIASLIIRLLRRFDRHLRSDQSRKASLWRSHQTAFGQNMGQAFWLLTLPTACASLRSFANHRLLRSTIKGNKDAEERATTLETNTRARLP